MSVPTLVVGIASVREPERLLLEALELAEAVGATLHVVHAYEHPEAALRHYSRDARVGRLLEDRYRAAMRQELEACVRELSGGVRVHCHAVPGQAAKALRATAEAVGADLLLVGASTHGWLLRTVLGSTAERVIRTAVTPVLIMRTSFERPLRRVVVTTDLSEESAWVYDRGIALLRTLFPGDRPELRTLLVVWHDLVVPTLLEPRSLEIPAREELAAFLSQRPASDLPNSERIRVGNPAREITAEALSFAPDLLVLGTHGRSGSPRLLLGSVAEATVRAAHGNVLVLPVGRKSKIPSAGTSTIGTRTA